MSGRARWGAWLLLLGSAAWTRAESIWERRDPNTCYLFADTKARRVGDLLTIVVDESTEFEGLEKREMDRQTKTVVGQKLAGQAALQKLTGSGGSELDSTNNLQRKFDGKNNSTIDRKFLDRMTVTVVAVLPNGNLVIEGCRTRVLNREVRVLKVTGVVRPQDIGAFNTLQSRYIADFHVSYVGRGPESRYTNHNPLGRFFNLFLP